MDIIFYDRHGKATAYSEDGESICLYGTGDVVAYVYGDMIYAYSGNQLGWYERGWVRDMSGEAVLFTDDASGSGPVKPSKGVRPSKPCRRTKPVKSSRSVRKTRPVFKSTWSALSGRPFFYQ